MSGAKSLKSPREIIERIRTHRYLLDIDGESEMVKEGALNLQTELNNALTLLSHDLYSKKSHFVLELVQNADDNDYNPGVVPHLAFGVTPKRLVVVNNEVGFSEPNIQAICSVGRSSKTGRKSGYIGEKGIGFKSVFLVSNAPEIHSNGYHFRFDRRDENNLLGYVVPQWCGPTEDARENQTTIILPAGRNSEFSEQTLAGLDGRLLLFLRKLRELAVERGGQKVVYRRRDKDGLTLLTTERELSGGSSSAEETRYVRSELIVPMEKCVDEKRTGIDRSALVLAFPVDSNGEAKPDASSNVFAFLPVRQVGFKFAIQADFILSASREDILTDRPWNLQLRAGIASAFRGAIETFKKTEALALSYLKFLPAEGEVSDAFFKSVGLNILQLLAKTECLPSASGRWKLPSDLRIADLRFRELFPSGAAWELFGFDYVDHRVQGGTELLFTLGAKNVTAGDILNVFKNHGPWLLKQRLEWRAKFYAYLADVRHLLIPAGLLECACLPTAGGTLVVPARTSVFFPLTRDKRYGFEDELVFVDNELFEEAKLHSPNVGALFADIKVKSDDPYDMVMSHILPKHLGDSWVSSERKALIGHLRYVKDKLKIFLERAATEGKSEAQAFKILRDGMWVGTKHVDDEGWQFDRAERLYLSKEYRPQFCIESQLGDALGLDRLVSAAYLAAKPKNPETEAESWRQFFTNLGLRLSPALEAHGADWKCSHELQLLLDSPQASVRRATLEALDRNWAAYAGRVTYSVSAGKYSIVQIDTKFAVSLRATLAPTRKRSTAALSDSFFPTTEITELLGDNLSYVDAKLSPPMLEACRVTYKLDAKALIKRLRLLKAEGGDTIKQLQRIYRALETLWDTDGAYIKQAFQTEALIRTKGLRKAWSMPEEVSWRSNGTFLDSLYPPLSGQYRDFSDFFLKKLGIPRELPTEKWVEALAALESVDSPEVRRNEALAIYKHANRDLAPKPGRHEPVQPEWLVTFEDEAVFINHRDEMVANDETLFADDAPDFSALFRDDDEISFIGIPSTEVPRLGRLLDAAGVQRLSSSLHVEVTNAEDGVVDAELTARVHRSINFLARVLYARNTECFERAIEGGQIAQLRELEVAQVPQVELSVALGEVTRTTQTDIAISTLRVLYRTGAKAIKDRLAAELCRFLGAPDELSDSFARVLMEESADGIEDFLKVRNIGNLPADLQEVIESFSGVQGEDADDDEPGEDVVDSVDATEWEPSVDLPSAVDGEQSDEEGQSKATRDSSLESTRSSESSAKSATGGDKDSPSSQRPSPSNGELAPFGEPVSGSMVSGSATSLSGSQPSQTGVRSGGPKGSLPGTQLPRVAEGIAPTVQPGEAAPGSEVGQQGAAGFPATGDSPPGHKWTLPGSPTTSPGRRPRRGQSNQPRTRSGRLMSYAAGPGDQNRPNPDDDPSKVAARMAAGKAAVEYFMTTQRSSWRSLTEMPHNNPGFDVSAIAHDGAEEFIEVKGQSAAWTEDGIALTPTELMKAQQEGERYWLCVVEHVHDERQRRLYLLRDPFGLTQQFRFDSGWKSAAFGVEAVPLRPEKDMSIEMPGIGRGRIVSARPKGRFFNLHVMMEDGREVNKLFNPATMKLSRE